MQRNELKGSIEVNSGLAYSRRLSQGFLVAIMYLRSNTPRFTS